MIIKGKKVFSDKGHFESLSIRIEQDKITEVAPSILPAPYEECMDFGSSYIIPGLIDIHLHGCMKEDFCNGSKEAFDTICEFELHHGITSISPATMTLSDKELTRIFEFFGSYQNTKGSRILGLTMEGPFINEEKSGAQNKLFIAPPSPSLFRKYQNLSNHAILQVAIAPEKDVDYEFIKELHEEVHISLAHTNASYETAHKAFLYGADHVTHLYNAMPAFSHRNPGVIGAAFDQNEVYVELIADGLHVDPSVIRMTYAMFGADRICLISDSMEATGLQAGTYSLGGQEVYVSEKKASLKDGTLAGSVTPLTECLRKAVLDMNIPLESAVKSCTITPAKSLGLDKKYGSLSVEKAADLVVLNSDLEIEKVMFKGSFCQR